MEISSSDCGPRSGPLQFVLAWFGTSLITPSENRRQVGAPPASPVICTSLYDSHFGTSAPVCRVCLCQPPRVSRFWWGESNAVPQDFYSLIEIFARALDRAERCSSILSCVNCFHRQNTKLCNGQQNNVSGNWLYQCFLLLCVPTLVSDVLSNEAQSFLLG